MSTNPIPISPSLHALCIDGRNSDIKALLASLLSSSSTPAPANIPIIDSSASDEGTTPLMYACRYGRSSTVLLLLEHGADPLKKDINGSNALFYAVRYRRSDTVKTLLEFNYDASSTSFMLESTTNVGNNIIHEASNAGDATSLHILLNHFSLGGKIANVINATNREGHTPLHFACDHDSIDCAKLLVSQGAIVSVLDNDGMSPFHLSCMYNRFEIALLFVRVGGGVDPRRILSPPSCKHSSSSSSSFSHHFDKNQVQKLIEEFDKCDMKENNMK